MIRPSFEAAFFCHDRGLFEIYSEHRSVLPDHAILLAAAVTRSLRSAEQLHDTFAILYVNQKEELSDPSSEDSVAGDTFGN